MRSISSRCCCRESSFSGRMAAPACLHTCSREGGAGWVLQALSGLNYKWSCGVWLQTVESWYRLLPLSKHMRGRGWKKASSSTSFWNQLCCNCCITELQFSQQRQSSKLSLCTFFLFSSGANVEILITAFAISRRVSIKPGESRNPLRLIWVRLHADVRLTPKLHLPLSIWRRGWMEELGSVLCCITIFTEEKSLKEVWDVGQKCFSWGVDFPISAQRNFLFCWPAQTSFSSISSRKG